MIQDFPIYTSHDNGNKLVKHINSSKCIMVFHDAIRTLDYSNKFSDEQSHTSNYWDEYQEKKAFEISKKMFDEFRFEVIHELINY